jgi:hypothetical protein
MNSSKIYFAILFCGGDYTECRLYQAALGEGPSPFDDENQDRSTKHFPSSRKVSG